MSEFVSAREFASIMGVSEKTVKGWVKKKVVPSFRVGDRLIRIPRDAGIKAVSSNVGVK